MKQIYPASITSKSFAAGGSVLDHKFGKSEPYTLGVEEEYMLLDPETFDLVQHVDTVLGAITGSEFEAHVHPGADAVGPRGRDARLPHARATSSARCGSCAAYVTRIAQEQGLRVGSSGTHPFSLFERQRITARDRYRNLIDQMQYVARRELIFGLHVHVAVGDPDTAIQVVNGLLSHLASLLALSASSPFWRGEPTGLSSSRQMVFAAFPRSGPPPRFRDYADYAEVVGQLEKTGCIADYTHIWWDIRPHPRLGTVEVRICDAVTRLEDAVAIAAYVQCARQAVRRAARGGRDDSDLPPHPHDREQVARGPLRPGGAGDGPRDRQAESRSRRAADPADAEGARAARARARRRAGARGHPQHPRAAATAPTGSCGSSTRTATSSRS